MLSMKSPGGKHDGHYCGERAVDGYRDSDDIGDAMSALPEWENPLHGIRANDTDCLRESHAALLAAAKEAAEILENFEGYGAARAGSIVGALQAAIAKAEEFVP
jgi:hypothetical protein